MGWISAGRVRDRPKTDYTYFILLTAVNTGRENLRHAMDAGIDDFFTKPLDREAMLMRLRVAERILEYTHANSAAQGTHSHLHVLQAHPGRHELLGSAGNLHPRPYRQQFQPRHLPRVLRQPVGYPDRAGLKIAPPK